MGLLCDQGHPNSSEELGDEVGMAAGSHPHGLRCQAGAWSLAVRGSREP